MAEIKISLDGNKWCALVGENLQEGEAWFGDTPYEVLEQALEAQADYKAACQRQSATIRFFELEPGNLDIRFIFHPALTPETKETVVTKAITVCMQALKEAANDEPRIIVPR